MSESAEMVLFRWRDEELWEREGRARSDFEVELERMAFGLAQSGFQRRIADLDDRVRRGEMTPTQASKILQGVTQREAEWKRQRYNTQTTNYDYVRYLPIPPATFRGSQGIMTRGYWWKVGLAPDCMRRAHERLVG
jgi:hypothetical protein